MRELLRAGRDDAAAEPGWPYLLAEFRAIALRDRELNRRYADAHARTIDGIASALEKLYEPTDLTPPVSVRSLAEFLQAGTVGVALERAANPDALPDQDAEQIILRALGLKDAR